MTTTNHTPFDLPETYKPYPLNLPPSLEMLLGTEKEIAMKNFLTYQYANDCLGKLINRIQDSKLKDNTIIVAVGDHSAHQLLDVAEEYVLQDLSVPLIMIVPDKYKPSYAVDVTRFGSHKDVFPTLFNLSLSNSEYVKSGNNLLSPPTDSTYFFGVYKYEIGLSKDGYVRTKENLYFDWKDNSFSLATPASKSDQGEFLQLKTRAYSAAMSCYIKNELSKGK
jgi:phosphoglycerol transferase MdoB-like AlkP superfamily enzyme